MDCTTPYRDYVGSVDWSEEDAVIHGKILYIQDMVSYEADDFDGIQAAFEAAVDHYLETCAELGDQPNAPYPAHYRKIDDAPRDGTHIHVVRPSDQKLYEAWFSPEGFSRVGTEFVKTGTWDCEEGGWFEKGEVQYWLPIA